MNNEDIKNDAERIKELCQSIIKEVVKWRKHPEAVFTHGYTREKADMIIYYLDKHGG